MHKCIVTFSRLAIKKDKKNKTYVHLLNKKINITDKLLNHAQ